MQENYKTSLAAVLKYEGGYSAHPKDPGGATQNGVTQATYDGWRKKHGLPVQSVRNISRDEIEQIYRRDFWDRVCGDSLPSGLDLCVFDYAVNSGPKRAIRDLQYTLGVTADGIMGPQTLAMANDNPKACGEYCDRRLRFMQGLRIWPTFGKGWSARVADVKKKGLALAAKAPVVVAKAIPHEEKEKSFFDEVGDFFDWTKRAPAPAPTVQPHVLQGEKTKIATAIIAALGALSVLDWNLIISNPRVGYTMVASALAVSIGHVYLPSFLWWLLPKEQHA